MPAARTTRARERNDQLTNRYTEASEAGRTFAQALAELADDNANRLLEKFLDDWIEASGLQRTKSRLRKIELWVADRKKEKKEKTKGTGASAVNKREKSGAKPKKNNGGKPGKGGDDFNGTNGDGLDDDDPGGGGLGDDGQDGDELRAGAGAGAGAESGLYDPHGDGASGTGGDNDGGSASGGDDARSNDGAGDNSEEADNGRVHDSQDGQESNGHHAGRNDLPGEQVQENQPRDDHVQNNGQSDRQGDGLTEQPQDRQQGEDDVLAGAQAVMQSSMEGGVNEPSAALGHNGHGHDQDNGQAYLLADESHHEQQRPQWDSQGLGDEPEHLPQPNSQGLDSQNNIQARDTSPRDHFEKSGVPDHGTANGFYGSTVHEGRPPFQATVEDCDGLPIPEKAANSSPSLAAGGYTKGGRQEYTRSSMLFPTPAKTRPPGTVQTPVVRLPQPNTSPPSPSSRDSQGLDWLLTATQLPDPLRLTARAPEKEGLSRTVRLLFAMPGNDQLSRSRQGDITSFVGSLFDKGSYWALRNNMLRHVERTGFRTENADGLDRDRLEKTSIASFASSRSPSADSRLG